MKLNTGTFNVKDLVKLYRPPILAEVFAGNKVMYASGGPKMTVVEDSTDQVQCQFEEDDSTLTTMTFDIRFLVCWGAEDFLYAHR